MLNLILVLTFVKHVQFVEYKTQLPETYLGYRKKNIGFTQSDA